MIELRTAPLEDHIEYFLDCAVECYELDACSHFVLRLYGRNEDLLPILGPERTGPITVDITHVLELPTGHMMTHGNVLLDRRAKCDRLSDVADRVLAELPPEQAGGLAYQGLIEIPNRIADLAEVFGQWAITDETVGGDLKDFRDHERVDRNDDPAPRLRRRLMSPRFARWFIRNRYESYDLQGMVERSLARARSIPAQHLRSTYGAIHKALRQQMKAERHREYERRLAIAAPVLKPQQKKMLVRAARTATNVVGERAVTQFIRGEDVTIPGEQISLVIGRSGSLATIGHSAVSVHVKDLAGAHLGQLCVYFEGTPALDQLTALALHMQAGLEAEVLATANVISATELGHAHPLFKRVAKIKLDATVASITDPRRSFGLSRWERDRARSVRYWAAAGGMWMERLGTFVLGRNRNWLDAAIAAGRRHEQDPMDRADVEPRRGLFDQEPGLQALLRDEGGVPVRVQPEAPAVSWSHRDDEGGPGVDRPAQGGALLDLGEAAAS